MPSIYAYTQLPQRPRWFAFCHREEAEYWNNHENVIEQTGGVIMINVPAAKRAGDQ
jgi:hypothetical protein